MAETKISNETTEIIKQLLINIEQELNTQCQIRIDRISGGIPVTNNIKPIFEFGNPTHIEIYDATEKYKDLEGLYDVNKYIFFMDDQFDLKYINYILRDKFYEERYSRSERHYIRIGAENAGVCRKCGHYKNEKTDEWGENYINDDRSIQCVKCGIDWSKNKYRLYANSYKQTIYHANNEYVAKYRAVRKND